LEKESRRKKKLCSKTDSRCSIPGKLEKGNGPGKMLV